MTQTNLFQYAVPTGDDERPIYRMTAREWVEFVAGIPVPHACRPPRVEISNEYSAPGTDNLLAFFYCQAEERVKLDKPDDVLFPDIMEALYNVTAALIADGWLIDHCDVLGWYGRGSNIIDLRIVAMRWQEGRVVDSPRWRFQMDPTMQKMADKVPLRCAEDLVRCGYCGGTGCMFCDHRGVMLEKRRRR